MGCGQWRHAGQGAGFCDVYKRLGSCQRCTLPLFGRDILLSSIGRVAISMFTESYRASGDQYVY